MLAREERNPERVASSHLDRHSPWSPGNRMQNASVRRDVAVSVPGRASEQGLPLASGSMHPPWLDQRLTRRCFRGGGYLASSSGESPGCACCVGLRQGRPCWKPTTTLSQGSVPVEGSEPSLHPRATGEGHDFAVHRNEDQGRQTKDQDQYRSRSHSSSLFGSSGSTPCRLALDLDARGSCLFLKRVRESDHIDRPPVAEKKPDGRATLVLIELP